MYAWIGGERESKHAYEAQASAECEAEIRIHICQPNNTRLTADVRVLENELGFIIFMLLFLLLFVSALPLLSKPHSHCVELHVTRNR